MKKPLSLTVIDEEKVSLKNFQMRNHAEDRELIEALRSVIRKELTPQQRKAVLMYYDMSMSVDKIAEKERITQSAVYHRLRRARKALYKYLKYYFGSSE